MDIMQNQRQVSLFTPCYILDYCMVQRFGVTVAWVVMCADVRWEPCEVQYKGDMVQLWNR